MMPDQFIPSAEGVSMFEEVNALANRAEAAEARVVELEAALRSTIPFLDEVYMVPRNTRKHVLAVLEGDAENG